MSLSSKNREAARAARVLHQCPLALRAIMDIKRASSRLRFAATAGINASHRCRSRRRERAARADRASEPAHLREIIRDGSSVRHQTKGNNLRCHNDLAWGEGKGRREYAYTPERPSAVFLLGCTHHRNGDRGCEPPHLSVVSECRARMDASSVYRAQKPRHGRPMAGFLLLTFAPASVGKRAAR